MIDFAGAVLQNGAVTKDGPPCLLRGGSGWFAATLRLLQGSPHQVEEAT